MKSTELKAKIDKLQESVKPILAELEKLNNEYRDAVSCEFVEKNNITLDMVQRSDDHEVFHGSVWNFAEWMRNTKCTKPYAEWNGRLYETLKLLAGRMDHDAPGLFEHVKK